MGKGSQGLNYLEKQQQLMSIKEKGAISPMRKAFPEEREGRKEKKPSYDRRDASSARQRATGRDLYIVASREEKRAPLHEKGGGKGSKSSEKPSQ